MDSFNLQRIQSWLFVIGLEAALLAFVVCVLYVATQVILSRLEARNRAQAEWVAPLKVKTRRILVSALFLLIVAVLMANAALLIYGVDVRSSVVDPIVSMTAERRGELAAALGKLALAAVALLVLTRPVRGLIAAAEAAINRWGQLRANSESLARFFKGLYRLIVTAAWMLLAVLACGWLGLPPQAGDALMVLIRIYLTVSIGILTIRSTAVIVEALAGVTQRAAQRRGWMAQYEQLRTLLPTLQTCLEYSLWIGVCSIVLLESSSLRYLAMWGPRLIGAIWIYFAGRAFIELGKLEIGHRMLPREGLLEAERRRRMTIVPLVRSGFTYAAYFATAVLILGGLGFNPMPFLAGAGILGLVVGFGAQSMIDDVVSGFFILLENMFLVGDTIEVGPARGVVEAIEFRTTRIRDSDGRLHIIRNGAVKPVVNYSKDYTMAVVPVEVTYDVDLRGVFHTLHRAGEHLRADNTDVLAETVVDGIMTFGASTMTVRTSTRVKPGRHEAVAAQLRLLIKEQFDRQAPSPRNTLVPPMREDRQQRPAAGRN